MQAYSNLIRWCSITILSLFIAPGVFAQGHTKDSLDTVKKALAEKKAVLIDVREQSEWDDGHLKDAKLLPLSSLKDGALPKGLELLLPKDKAVYLHCAAGRKRYHQVESEARCIRRPDCSSSA